MDTVEYGEYGQVIRGWKATQLLQHDGGWYAVDYVVENRSDVMGTVDVLTIRKVRDEFGMGTVTFVPVDDRKYALVEETFLGMMQNMMKWLG